MTTQNIITTLAGGFIFPFLICVVWGQFFGKYNLIGSALAAGFIVGTTWVLNHGVATHYVIQGPNVATPGGAPWVDMAFAAFAGIFVNGIVLGGKAGKAMPTLLCAIIGGVLGGFIISCATP